MATKSSRHPWPYFEASSLRDPRRPFGQTHEVRPYLDRSDSADGQQGASLERDHTMTSKMSDYRAPSRALRGNIGDPKLADSPAMTVRHLCSLKRLAAREQMSGVNCAADRADPS